VGDSDDPGGVGRPGPVVRRQSDADACLPRVGVGAVLRVVLRVRVGAQPSQVPQVAADRGVHVYVREAEQARHAETLHGKIRK